MKDANTFENAHLLFAVSPLHRSTQHGCGTRGNFLCVFLVKQERAKNVLKSDEDKAKFRKFIAPF